MFPMIYRYHCPFCSWEVQSASSERAAMRYKDHVLGHQDLIDWWRGLLMGESFSPRGASNKMTVSI